MKILECLKIEWKIFTRGLWFYLAILGSLIYFGKKTNDLLIDSQPGQIVNGTANIVQAGIFIFLVYGILLARREKSEDSYEVFRTIQFGWGAKTYAKCIHIINVSLLFSLLHILLLHVFFVMYAVPWEFYISSVIYIILYWFLTFIVTGLIGVILGLNIESKVVYLITIILGILLGPLNQTVFISLTQVLPTWLQDLMFMVNLGQSDPQRYYHIVYGNPVEYFRWYTKIYFLLIVTAILVMTVHINDKRKGIKLFLYPACISLTVLSGYMSWLEMSPHLDRLTSRQALEADYSYYAEDQYIESSKNERDFDVKKYNMDLVIDEGIHNLVTITLMPNYDTKSLVFHLYRDLRIKQMTLNNKVLSYQQQDDKVKVMAPEIFKRDNEYNLTIEYQGASSQRLFANNHAVMLPGFFPWYPIPAKHPIASGESFHSYKFHEPVQYRMTYKGPLELFTNLGKESEHVWSGESTSGIVLVSGAMENINLGSVNLVRPYALYKMSNRLDEDMTRYLTEYQTISEFLGFAPMPVNTFFLLETRLNNTFVWIEDGYVIMDVNALSNKSDLLTPDVSSITEGIVRSYGWDRQNLDMKLLFTHAVSYCYGQLYLNEVSENTYFRRHFPSYLADYFPEHTETYNDLVDYLDTHMKQEEVIQAFFRDWLDKIEVEQENFYWDSVNELIHKER